MTGIEWTLIGCAMGIACLCAMRWYVTVLDCRESHYSAVWRNQHDAE